MKVKKQNLKWKNMTRQDRISRILYLLIRLIVLVIIILSAIFYFFTEKDESRSRLVFNGVMAFVLLMLSLVPSTIERTLKIEIPTFMEITFIVLATLAFLLGEIGDFYITYPWWDSFLHTVTGGLIACVGFVILNLLNDNSLTKTKIHIPPVFAVVFVFCFSLACGGIWEMIEWIMDSINGTNMQRHRDNITGIPFEGRDALKDTMKDFFLDALGAIIVSIIGFFDIKRNTNFMLNTFKVELMHDKNEEKDLDENK